MALAFIVIVIAVATLATAALRFSEPSAISPWEPAIAMEAMRFVRGISVYDPGHATHIYGPLLTILIAGVFCFSGLNLLVARIVLSFFSFGLAGLLTVVLCRGAHRKYWVVSFLLFLGLNFRTNLVLFSAQPDGIAALLGVGALCLWIARGQVRLGSVISILMFLCAMLFKQTSAAFALIPVVYSLAWRRTWSGLLTAAIPILSIGAALAAIDLLSPQLFKAMVTVPASIRVNYGRAVPTLLYLISTFPIFMVAVAATFVTPNEIRERYRWIWSAIIVLVPVSIWAMCKSGGSYNSLLLGYLAMTSLVVVKLSGISNYIRSLRTLPSLLTIILITGAMLFSIFAQYHRDFVLLVTTFGSAKYSAVVQYAQQLPGQVVSPQDPTIAYRARGYFGRSLFFELDTHAVNGNWPNTLPKAVDQELEQAKFVIQAESYVPTPVFERGLLAHRFHPLAISDLSGSPYTVWMKEN
ncbi:MAG: hypothetical protein ACJ8M1_01740 [Chthoniobacterales bacterium]